MINCLPWLKRICRLEETTNSKESIERFLKGVSDAEKPEVLAKNRCPGNWYWMTASSSKLKNIKNWNINCNLGIWMLCFRMVPTPRACDSSLGRF